MSGGFGTNRLVSLILLKIRIDSLHLKFYPSPAMRKLTICAKCSDMFSATLNDGQTIKQYDGYVPDFFPDQHWGDYVMLEINIDTGKILNWKKPTKADLAIFK